MKTILPAAITLAIVAISVVPAGAQSMPSPKPSIGNTTTEVCGSELGYMPRVHPSDVDAVDDGFRVWITEVCAGEDILRADGNASGVRSAIEANGVLMRALAKRNFDRQLYHQPLRARFRPLSRPAARQDGGNPGFRHSHFCRDIALPMNGF